MHDFSLNANKIAIETENISAFLQYNMSIGSTETNGRIHIRGPPARN